MCTLKLANRTDVALTFDDGPDEKTLEITSLLERLSTPASFFWITQNATLLKEKDKELFNKLVRKTRNHTIAYHGPYDYIPNLSHRMFTKYSFDEFKVGLEKLEHLIGRKIKFYRPHYLLQPLSLIYARKLGLKAVLGSFSAYAEPDTDMENQISKFSKASGGDIIIFHEGKTQLREVKTPLSGIESVINNLRERKLNLVSL